MFPLLFDCFRYLISMLITHLLKHQIWVGTHRWPTFRDGSALCIGADPYSCTGFGWDRVDFLPSSEYGAMFWICAENSVGKTRFSYCWAVSRPFLPLRLPCQRAGWGCTRSWEGTQPGHLTPADQREILCHMGSCSAIKRWGEGTALGLAGHPSVGGKRLLSFASLVCLGFYFPLSLILFSLFLNFF